MSQQANDNSESRFMGLMTRIADKTGALGSVVSAMGWALLQIVGGDKLIIPFC